MQNETHKMRRTGKGFFIRFEIKENETQEKKTYLWNACNGEFRSNMWIHQILNAFHAQCAIRNGDLADSRQQTAEISSSNSTVFESKYRITTTSNPLTQTHPII